MTTYVINPITNELESAQPRQTVGDKYGLQKFNRLKAAAPLLAPALLPAAAAFLGLSGTGLVLQQKVQNYFENNPEALLNRFTDKLDNNIPISSLNLNKLYVITTSRSASASELLINGLDPYIDVIHIGDYTVGKNQGSITVYDYINDSRDKNPNHKYAMQPIVLKIGNVAGYTDFPDGLIPDIIKKESISNPGILGDPEEPLLKIALDNIRGIQTSISQTEDYKQIDKPTDEIYQRTNH